MSEEKDGLENIQEFSSEPLEVCIDEAVINEKERGISSLASTLKSSNKISYLLKTITVIDLTSLNGNETAAVIEDLCKKAVNPIKLNFTWDEPIHTAAVCIYPIRIEDAEKTLKSLNKENEVSIATVAGGFPSRRLSLQTRMKEIEQIARTTVKEIDIVIDRTLALNHKWSELYEELKAMRKACPRLCMKTILATGDLSNLQDIYKASMVAMMAGTDFIKTSTGKEAINATLPAGIVMCRAIKDYHKTTGRKVGLKPAGGIKTATDALQWLILVKQELGEEWLNKNLFRIGASSLLDNVVSEIHSTS